VLLAPPALLIVSGDEAAADQAVRELAESAQSVIALTMFQGLAVGWADLVLPGTSSLERDGSLTNMEGRVQRLRRAVIPPAPDELAWLSKLAERFGVVLSPYASLVHEEVFGTPFEELGETAPLQPANNPQSPSQVPGTVEEGRGLRLVRYRPLFSGPAVERVEKFRFQRPDGLVDLARDDAHRLGVGDGDEVNVRTNGTSATLRARIRRNLRAGVVLVPEGSADELVPGTVEVTPA
jgi:predicted molibdopterin-dependent oxidoreductase YjgC